MSHPQIKRTVQRFVFLCLLLPFSSFGAASKPLIHVELLSQRSGVLPSSHDRLAILMTPQSGWHGYWEVPGDVGFPTTITWSLPKGFSVGDTQYPVPETMMTGDIVNYVYPGQFALITPISFPEELSPDQPIILSVKLDYLVCNDEGCVPESSTAQLTLPVYTSELQVTEDSRFNTWLQRLPRPLASPAHFQIIDDGQLQVTLPLPEAVDLPSPYLFVKTEDAIDYNTEQAFTRNHDELIMQTAAAEDFDLSELSAVLAFGNGTGLEITATKDVNTGSESAHSAIGNQKSSLWTTALFALAGAILGGLILNLMPCVLPILSLKILHVANSAQQEAKKNALAYTAGVIAVCTLLGAAILFARYLGMQLGWAFQLQTPVTIYVLILLVTAIALNLAGLFELNPAIGGDQLTRKEGWVGSFWTGVLAAFVATPCSGPFMAAALGSALILPPAIALCVFAGLGLGIALPFLLIAYIPRLNAWIPRPGPWMQTLKELLTLPMLLTLLALLWVIAQQASSTGLLIAITGAMLLSVGLWFSGNRQRKQKNKVWYPALISLVLAAGLYAAADSYTAVPLETSVQEDIDATTNVLVFDRNELERLRSEGKTLFVYFSADWCITCKLNETTVIHKPEIQKKLAAANIVVMVGDWTDGDPAITEELTIYGRSGVPLYLWFKPGADEPIILPQILTMKILTDLME